MRLHDDDGRRLYLDAPERARFLQQAAQETAELRMFCELIHYTGVRPSEALQTTPGRINVGTAEITFWTLKKRKVTMRGKPKPPEYRTIPVPRSFVDKLDLCFELRDSKKSRKSAEIPLWEMSRTTAWRVIKRVMDNADIAGPQATTKGLRHGFAIALLTGGRPPPLHLISRLLGHSTTKTTEIYTTLIGQDLRDSVMAALERQSRFFWSTYLQNR